MDAMKIGMCWHVHHSTRLVEWCHDLDGRIAFVKAHKKPEQVKTRLKLMKMVKGELPEEVISASKAFAEAGKALAEAGKACNEAGKAFDDAILRNLPAIIKLHEEECPNCPWDGRTIFPSGG